MNEFLSKTVAMLNDKIDGHAYVQRISDSVYVIRICFKRGHDFCYQLSKSTYMNNVDCSPETLVNVVIEESKQAILNRFFISEERNDKNG